MICDFCSAPDPTWSYPARVPAAVLRISCEQAHRAFRASCKDAPIPIEEEN